jgi:hypothetical protein
MAVTWNGKSQMQVNWRDAASGGIFVVVGAFFAISAIMTLPIGTAFRMGPGFFPLTLGVILAAIGAIVLFGSVNKPSEPGETIAWRGIFFVLVPPILFGLFVRELGLAICVALVVGLVALASREMTVRLGLALVAGLTLFCVLIFGYGLQIPLPLIGSWFDGWRY